MPENLLTKKNTTANLNPTRKGTQKWHARKHTKSTHQHKESPC